jgi:hypothetical protein
VHAQLFSNEPGPQGLRNAWPHENLVAETEGVGSKSLLDGFAADDVHPAASLAPELGPQQRPTSDADAQREIGVSAAECAVALQSVEGTADHQPCRIDTRLRVVFENGENRVPGEGDDVAAGCGDLIDEGTERLVEEEAELLCPRTPLLAQLGGE